LNKKIIIYFNCVLLYVLYQYIALLHINKKYKKYILFSESRETTPILHHIKISEFLSLHYINRYVGNRTRLCCTCVRQRQKIDAFNPLNCMVMHSIKISNVYLKIWFLGYHKFKLRGIFKNSFAFWNIIQIQLSLSLIPYHKEV